MTTKTPQNPAATKVPVKLLRRPIPALQLGPAYPTIEDITRRQFLIGAGSLLVLAPYGCGGLASEQREALEECEDRPVEHPLGAACVPEDPERIVVMDADHTLDSIIALGIEPVGAAAPSYTGGIPDHLIREVEGDIESVGTTEQPNLETITALSPELMIGTAPLMESFYEELSQIGPTVGMEFEQTAWKERLRRTGEILGREDRAEELLTEYEDRVSEFREATGDQLGGATVTLTRVTDLGFRYITFGGSFPGTILTDAGLEQPPDQEPGEIGEPFVEISEEDISTLEADYIFVSVDGGQEGELENLRQNSLWNGLEGEKIQVSSNRWIFGGILTANAILSDLEEHLLGGG